MSEMFKMEGTHLEKYEGDELIVRVPDGVETIGDKAFARLGEDGYYSNAVEIDLPACVRHLAPKALLGCVELKVLRIRKTEISLGTGVFYNVKSGLNIYFAGSSDAWKKAIQPRSDSRNRSYDGGWNGGAPGCYWDEYYLYPMGHENEGDFTCTVHCEADGVIIEQKGCRLEAFVHHHSPYDG